MTERDRIIDQILKSASVALDRPLGSLRCETRRVEDRWVARVADELERDGATEREALGELLSSVVSLENYRSAGFRVTPAFVQAIELLSLSRRELIEMVRQELESNPPEDSPEASPKAKTR